MPKRRNGGQNGAAPAGGAAGDDDDDDDVPTREELIGIVNSAVTSQLGRRLPAMIGEAMAPITTQMTELAAAITGRQPGAQQPPAGGQQQGQPAPGAQPGQQGNTPELGALQQTVAQLQAQLKERDSAAAAAATRERESARDGAVSTALASLGVPPARVRGALAVVRESLHEVKDATAPGGVRYVYKAKRNGYEEDLDIAAGVAEWGAGDEGKAYLAPTQAVRGGAGTRPAPAGGNGAGRGQPEDPKVAKQQKIDQATAGLVQMITGASDGGTVNLGGD